jgi:O-antigen ligase
LADRGSYVHNAYLDVALSAGIVGLVPFLAIWMVTFYQLFQVRRIARVEKIDTLDDIALALFLGLAGLGIISMFGSAWDSKFLWSIVGVSSAVWNQAKYRKYLQPEGNSVSKVNIYKNSGILP